jgi:hypothetical protein
VASVGYSAAVIGNFEGGSLDGWVPAPFQSYVTGLASVAGVGNTLGSSSLQVSNNANDFWGPAKDLVASGNVGDIIANRYLVADVTFRGSELTGYAQVTDVALNDGSGYFQQRATISSPNNWAGANENVTRTLRWDLDQYIKEGVPYRQWLSNNPTPSHITLWAVSQSGGGPTGGPGRIYFDNIRLVPEPAALALAVLGATLALAARRRGQR